MNDLAKFGVIGLAIISFASLLAFQSYNGSKIKKFTVEVVKATCEDSGKYFPLDEGFEAKVWMCEGYMVFIPDEERPYVSYEEQKAKLKELLFAE